MAAVPQSLSLRCCVGFDPCCSSISGIWYLCLAIVVMVVLIFCNELLKTQCYFIGFPWSSSKLYYPQTVVDEEVQVLIVYNDDHNLQSTDLLNWPPPPPPYSDILKTIK